MSKSKKKKSKPRKRSAGVRGGSKYSGANHVKKGNKKLFGAAAAAHIDRRNEMRILARRKNPKTRSSR